MRIEDVDQRGEATAADDGWQWDEVRRFCVRIAYHYARNRSEAEDIAQDAILRAWRRRETLRADGSRERWLAAIVRNEAFRQAARVRPAPVEDLADDLAVDDERVRTLVEQADLHCAIRTLDRRDRQLVQMRYGQDLTQEGIARRLGIPEGTVKVQLHRLRAKLRGQLEPVES